MSEQIAGADSDILAGAIKGGVLKTEPKNQGFGGCFGNTSFLAPSGALIAIPTY